jgi:hypothetical protein
MNTRDIAGVQVGSEIVVGDQDSAPPHEIDDLGNTARRHTVVVPFRKRLRGNAEFLGERRLTSELLVTQGETGVSHNAPVLHSQFNIVNLQFICGRPRIGYHKPMVYQPKLPPAPDPAEFTEYKEWVRVFTDSTHGGQTLLAKASGTKPQAVTRWLRGAVPKDATLRLQARNLGVNYSALVLLASGANSSTSNTDNNAIRTAELLRHWKQIFDDDVQQLAIDYLKSLTAVSAKRTPPAPRHKKRSS